MEQATTIGLAIAKHVFQLHGADAAGHVLFHKRITRVKLLDFLAAQASPRDDTEASIMSLLINFLASHALHLAHVTPLISDSRERCDTP